MQHVETDQSDKCGVGNMSDEESSPLKRPRFEPPSSSEERFAEDCNNLIERRKSKHVQVESYAEKINDELTRNGSYSTSTPIKVLILAAEWSWWWWRDSSSYLATELAKQLAGLSLVKVTVLVPEGTSEKWEKKFAGRFDITLMEAKKQPEFKDSFEWLYDPPEGLTTDIVIGIGEKLSKVAQMYKKHHHCKSIFVNPDFFEEKFCRDNELRDALAETEDELYRGRSNFHPIMEMADLPVAVGPKMAEKLSSSLRYQDKQVFNLTPGIVHEYAAIKHAGCDSKKFRVLVASGSNSSNFCRERLNTVASAVARLEDRSYEVISVGTLKGKQEGFCEKFHECGIPKHQLIIRGPPNDEEDLKRWLCEADLAVMPSSEQEFGMFGLRALSSGLPILVHGASGLGEALKPVIGGSSSIVESDDIIEWSKAIKKVREKDRTVRLKEADLLRKRYDEMYSWKKQSKDLVKEMLKMVSAQQGQTQQNGIGVRGSTKGEKKPP